MRLLFDSHVFSTQKNGGASRYHYEILNKLDKFNIKILPAHIPMVSTIHDMIPERLGHVSPLQTLKHQFSLRGNKISAISEHTKQDIIYYYNLPHDKIEVVHHGVSLASSQACEPKTILPEKYISHVGCRQEYKNFRWLITRLNSLLQENCELKLVCAGGKSFDHDEIMLFNSLGIGNRIQGIFKLSDRELSYVYREQQLSFPPLYSKALVSPFLKHGLQKSLLSYRTVAAP